MTYFTRALENEIVYDKRNHDKKQGKFVPTKTNVIITFFVQSSNQRDMKYFDLAITPKVPKAYLIVGAIALMTPSDSLCFLALTTSLMKLNLSPFNILFVS